jgi:hypothetical protein
MKKYTYHIIISVILLVIAFILFLKDRPGTLKVDNRIFAVADTAAITTIRFSHGKSEIVLERSGANWFVNHSFNAKPQAVKRLLYLLMNLEIQAPVPNSMKKGALQRFHEKFVHVSVESGGQTLKSYRITENGGMKIGSIMMLAGDKEPYVVKVTGYDGHLSPLFITDPKFWRDKAIFRYQPADILSVEIKYPDHPEASFVYNFQGFGNISVRSLAGNRSVKISKQTARDFLLNFASVLYESMVETRTKQIFDSLSRQKPSCEITIKNAGNQDRKVKTYRIPVQHQEEPFDLNRMYAVLQNDTVPVVVKYTDFDPIMKQYSDFAVQ